MPNDGPCYLLVRLKISLYVSVQLYFTPGADTICDGPFLYSAKNIVGQCLFWLTLWADLGFPSGF
jgi:hypothetical protein